jgi:hypothetical protein
MCSICANRLKFRPRHTGRGWLWQATQDCAIGWCDRGRRANRSWKFCAPYQIKIPRAAPLRLLDRNRHRGPLRRWHELRKTTATESCFDPRIIVPNYSANFASGGLFYARGRNAEPSVRHGADWQTERAKTEKAIAAFASLADRLEAMAADQRRPWWRRLACQNPEAAHARPAAPDPSTPAAMAA